LDTKEIRKIAYSDHICSSDFFAAVWSTTSAIICRMDMLVVAVVVRMVEAHMVVVVVVRMVVVVVGDMVVVELVLEQLS